MAIAALAGLWLDPFQQTLLEGMTATRADGKWAAFEFGAEIPRQNGKTQTIIARILAGLYIFHESKIIYSAHKFETSVEIFEILTDLIESTPVLARKVRRIRRSNDNRSVTLKNGCQVRFMARTAGSGRGFSGETIILDEAYNVSSTMIMAIMPTLSARSMHGNPQIIFLSSCGLPTSVVMNGMRERALSGKSGRLTWLEWSADEEADSEDREAWYQANPSLGLRISEEYIADELAAARSDPEIGEELWRIERLGIRARAEGESIFPKRVWEARADPNRQWASTIAFAVDLRPERDITTISAASALPNGDVLVTVIKRFEGTTGVADALVELNREFRPKAIVVDGREAAGTLIEELRLRRIRVTLASLQGYAKACGLFFDLVIAKEGEPTIVHVGDPVLDAAVDGATRRFISDTAWILNRKNTLADISPLVAVIHAISGLGLAAGRPIEDRPRAGSRLVM